MGAHKPAAAKPRKPRRKKTDAQSKGLVPGDVARPSDNAKQFAALIESDGGAVIGCYREPYGGHDVVLAALPIDKVEPTPFQRDRSEPHVKRLASALERTSRFLDPLICVRKDARYWTPNGNHRLGAMQLLGMKTVTALVLPEEDAAFHILALNTEKAHNLKERSLEAIRMYRGLVGARDGTEASFEPILEEPRLVTFGACYEQRPRFSSGAYASVVKRLDAFLDLPLSEALTIRERRAAQLLSWDDAVVEKVATLKAQGLVSPYLKYFIVARSNFLRFKKEQTFEFEPTLEKLIAATLKVDTSKVSKDDVARMGGVTADSDEE
jgi:ParB family transcriptional regulator, chromosome partitioning protein